MQKVIVTVLISAVVFLSLGFSVGFIVGVFSTKGGQEFAQEFAQDFATEVTAIERPADLDNPKRIMQQRILLKHPGNWRVDVDEEEYDPETYFTIYSPGQSYISFEIWHEKIDAEELLRDYVNYYRDEFEMRPGKTSDSWGSYEGVGTQLTGSTLGEKHHIRIFCYESENTSFRITESFDEAGRRHTAKGYKLVESTFELFENVDDYIE